MKAKEMRSKLKEMTAEELNNKEQDLREDYFKLRFQHGVGQLENTARLNELRRDIARVQTVRNEKKA